MWFFFFVDGWGILVLLFLGLAFLGCIDNFVTGLIANLPEEICILIMVIIMLKGLFTMLGACEMETVPGKIMQIIRGLVMIFIFMVVASFLETGMGHHSLEEVGLPLFSWLGKKMHLNGEALMILTTVVLSIIILIVTYIPAGIAKILEENKENPVVWYVLYLVMVAVISIGGYKIAMKNGFYNSIQEFDLKKPVYTVSQDTDYLNEFAEVILIKTGSFQKGTPLYIHEDPCRAYNVQPVLQQIPLVYTKMKEKGEKEIIYVEVTDGKHISYVRKEDLKKWK